MIGQYDSPLRWFGSKQRMIGNLLPLLPECDAWVDVFFGGGSVTFSCSSAAVEVVNDLDGEVCNFYRVLQDPEKGKELIRRAELTPYSRQWYEEIRDGREQWENPPSDDIERAYRFFVVNRMSYSGWSGDTSKRKPSWSYSVTLDRVDMAASCSVWWRGVDTLFACMKRLRNVQIESKDFRFILSKYDTPETCFYLDPPYVTDARVRGGYKHEMTDDDHRDMVGLLLSLKGMAVLSGYAHPIYEPLGAAGWVRRDFETRVFCSGKGAKKNRRIESVWCNPAAEARRGLSLFGSEHFERDAEAADDAAA